MTTMSEERKEIFNFYIEPSLKAQVQNKLSRLTADSTKGQMASLIRVQLKLFVATPDDKINPLLLDAIAAEYEFSTHRNKRSRL